MIYFYPGLVALCLFAGLTGCGASNSGPPRFQISGEVLFEDVPVPVGEIMFTPDLAKGNDGPSTLVKIENGKYVSEAGEGVIGGPYQATLIGFDGKAPDKPDPLGTSVRGKALFRNRTVQMDLPKGQKVVENFTLRKEGR